MADDRYEPETEPFASRYTLVRDAEVRTWREDEAHMDFEMYRALALRYGEPVVGYVGGLHYHFAPSDEVFRGECAVPAHNHSDPSALLIQK